MMKYIVLALAALFAVVVAAEENVVTLTDATFKDFVKEHKYVLAEFYAPWCGHCKKLAPEYEAAATKLKEDPEIDVVLAKVDATEEKQIAEEHEIRGFPTLKFFVDGEAKEYTGGRTEDTIINWIKKKTGPPAKTLASAADFESFKEGSEVVVVGVFASEAEAETFNKVAADDDEVPYAIAIGNDDVAKAVGASSTPAVVLFKKFDEGRADYSGDLTDEEALAKFVSGNSLPLIVPFTQESAQKIFGGAIKQHLLLFIDNSDEASVKKVKDAASPVAKETQGDLLFVTIEVKTDARVIEFFGVTEEDAPTARIVELGDEGMRKFKMEDESAGITTESLKTFAQQHADGKLSPDLKSEDIPESNDGNVFVLVGKAFSDVVDGSKNVLVEFYAPWCGHCKKLEPEYEKVGEKFKGNDDVIIAKMDATANEVEEIQVSGFPTIKFFPKGSEEVVDYNGGRDADSIISFIEEKIGTA